MGKKYGYDHEERQHWNLTPREPPPPTRVPGGLGPLPSVSRGEVILWLLIPIAVFAIAMAAALLMTPAQ